MSIVIKKIGNRRYAYLAYRSGNKVEQKYMGPVSDPRVLEKIANLRREKAVPERFRPLFWDTESRKVDTTRHARYVIERVLEVGGLDALRWIQMLYPGRLILDVCEASRKLSQKSRNFWKIWLEAGRAS